MRPCIAEAAEQSFTTTTDGLASLAWRMLGTPVDSVWGAEHAAPLLSVAQQMSGNCVYLEVGAHVGWLVLLAARLGCKVFAWEGSRSCARRIEKNLVLNNLDSHARVFSKFVGSANGSKIEADLPAGTRISLLKMDIDGPDPDAMDGMDSLFISRRVEYVNLEYSRKQARRRANYLEEMHQRGFDIYLLDCYRLRTNETSIQLNTGGRARCLNRVENTRDFDRRSARSNELSDVPIGHALKHFLGCLLSAVRVPRCKSFIRDQLLQPQYYAAFTEAVGSGEVDLMLKLRQD